MLVLAVETSTPTVTAGVVEVARPHELAQRLAAAPAGSAPAADPVTVLAERTRIDAYGHVEHLLPLAHSALGAAQRTLADLGAIVVGIGPGPFTGLRVGMATAAALGDALGVPVHGVIGHDAMVRCLRPVDMPEGAMLVATDARRREVYFSGYDQRWRRLVGPAVAAPAAVAHILADAGLRAGGVTGSGADLLAPVLELPVVAAADPLVRGLALAAAPALLTAAVPGPLTPLYLRRPDAAQPRPPKTVLPPDAVTDRR